MDISDRLCGVLIAVCDESELTVGEVMDEMHKSELASQLLTIMVEAEKRNVGYGEIVDAWKLQATASALVIKTQKFMINPMRALETMSTQETLDWLDLVGHNVEVLLDEAKASIDVFYSKHPEVFCG